MFSLCLLWTSLVTVVFNRQLLRGGLDSLDVVAGMIYLVLLVPNCFNLLLYIFGFWLCEATQGGKGEAQSGKGEAHDAIRMRTAVVMPLYNEEMERVYAGVRQSWLSIRKSGLDQHCDFCLLCDSTDPEICAHEEEIYRRLVAEFDEDAEVNPARPHPVPLPRGEGVAAGNKRCRFFLIRRKERKGFKAGNIANFLENHGTNYDFMLVLDADSVMLGETIKRLIVQMQARPELGLLQTIIVPIRAVTPFARSMQYFIGRCVAMYSSGMYWFTGRDSIYWGHNALIRIAPFMANCNLPIMPGKAPFGGPIMSQDFVEAALLGRAGWAVEWDICQGGSFDELPANLITYGERDRRWCQGNLRNFWLAFGDRMKLAHRLFFGIGVMAYVASPLFLIMTILGFIQAVRGRSYQIESVMFWSFLSYFFLILLLPKILGLLRIVRWRRINQVEPLTPALSPSEGEREDPRQPSYEGGIGQPKEKRQRTGVVQDTTALTGAVPLPSFSMKKEALSMLLEFCVMIISAPTIFYLHTLFIVRMLLGKTVAWTSQPRDPAGQLSWSEATQAFWLPTVLGAIWLSVAAAVNPFSLAYLAPTLAGWTLSIPFAVLTSNVRLGAFLTRHGLFEDCLTEMATEELGPLIV